MLRGHFVYKIKLMNNKIDCFKSRFIVDGSKQERGMDYRDICTCGKVYQIPGFLGHLCSSRVAHTSDHCVPLALLPVYRNDQRYLIYWSFSKCGWLTESDWASDQNTQRSIFGCVFLMACSFVCWMSKLQPIVATSFRKQSTTPTIFLCKSLCGFVLSFL